MAFNDAIAVPPASAWRRAETTGIGTAEWACEAPTLPRAAPGATSERLRLLIVVGVAGFELATYWSQTSCATRLRYTPN